ncbi:hypothetical protein TREMEDRAFT_24694 [Tremella mesenterica DSM 1558]|uniref:uncharacterized protein n=1 Tax=Tremella mesenterica (strain ATCC 24925 / CBS 8224 / DSM 1558 / NBRC 9311 / NRRL Y-6157 / RJB 2259-6 / UBC 559-6) TaxID=578456 RepID=UPI0003F49044|nr:uncharacterized protein TREMEDRAFT_24694 [Tremella mesenterica DSM 1558]EIW72341.1 hypothetical protein TREMEDRAFT_24694 [Tremella mesenterica DSM 1558]
MTPPTPAATKEDSSYKTKDIRHIERTGLEKEHYEHVMSRNLNVSAKIQNPLLGVTRPGLQALVDDFCAEYGFEDKDLWNRAAILAQNPNDYDGIPELSQDDKYWAKREVTNKWDLTGQMWFLCFVASLGSAIQGWDSTGANGANLSFPREFGIENNTWLVGMVNSGPTLVTGLFSAMLCDPMNHYFGRRGTLFISGWFCIFPVLCQAFTHNWYELFICRCLLGVGIGTKISTIPIYTAESAPASIRGAVSLTFQFWVAFGSVLGFSTNLIFMRVGRLAWRFQLAAAFIPALAVVLLVWFIPESPRWLMKRNNYPKAFRSFLRLRKSQIQAARDMFYAHCQIQEENEAFHGTSWFTRMRDIFTVPRLRTANLASWVVMISQQLCGINVMAYYSSTVFVQAGYTSEQALLASLGFGLVNSVFAIPAIWTIDSFGRRNLMLFTFPLMSLCLWWAGSMFFMDSSNPARVPVIAVAVYIFTALYSPGEGPIPFLYSAESYPLTHREVGMSWAVSQNNLFSALLSLTFPSMLSTFKPYGAFYFYAGTNILAVILIFFFVPDTSRRTLEELDFIFGVPVHVFAKYQWSTWLPWFFKRYVLFQKDAYLKPLYHLEGIGGTLPDVVGGH